MTETETPTPSASERLAALPEPPNSAIDVLVEEARTSRWQKILLIAAGLGMSLGMMGAAIAWSSKDAAEERSVQNAGAAARALTQASAAAEQGKANQDGLLEANRRLAQLGKPTVPVPTITVTPEPPPIVQVEGLNASQSAAVRTIIAAEAGRLRPALSEADRQQIARTAASLVPKPADGKTPTAAQLQPLVSSAVDAFCSGNRCVGRPGAAVTGPPGRPGADSTVPGPSGKDAPPVSDEQLRSQAVAFFTAYCGQEGDPCRGKTGDQGLRGPEGTPGRGIRSTKCQEDGNWLFLYTDGSSESISGPCKVVVVPNPARATR